MFMDVVISFLAAAVMFFLATWRWVNVSQVSSFTLNYADDVDFCKASCHQAVFWSSMPFPHVVHQVFLLLLSQQLWVEWPSRMCFFNTCQQHNSVFCVQGASHPLLLFACNTWIINKLKLAWFLCKKFTNDTTTINSTILSRNVTTRCQTERPK